MIKFKNAPAAQPEPKPVTPLPAGKAAPDTADAETVPAKKRGSATAKPAQKSGKPQSDLLDL